MAKSLLEALQGQLNTKQTTAKTDFSGQAQGLLRTKSTGKALSSRGPQVQSDDEAFANQATQQQLNQQNTQNQIAAQQIGVQQDRIEMNQQQQNADLAQRAKQVNGQLATQETQILNDLDRQGQEVDYENDKQKLEQLGFTLALQDQEYLHQLQQQGQIRRLDDESEFKIQLQLSQFKDAEKLLGNDIDFRKMLELDDIAFKKELEKFKIDNKLRDSDRALEAAKSRQTQEASSGILSGIMGIFSSGS